MVMQLSKAEKLAAIMYMHARGVNTAVIAKRFNVSSGVINNLLRVGSMPKCVQHFHTLTPKGLTYSQIAVLYKAYKMDRKQFNVLCNEWGITIPNVPWTDAIVLKHTKVFTSNS